VDTYYWFKGDERQHTRQKNQLEYIVQADYWSRMWIVQEFTLAKKVFLLVGRDKISYDQLHRIGRYRRLFNGSHIISRSKTIAFINNRYGGLKGPRGLRFEYLFEGFGMLSCSIPQDGVFALLGLVGAREEELELVSMVDYNLTVWQLLQRILDSNVLANSPFRFTEQYNRFVIKGQQDKYMCGPIHVKLAPNSQWELCGPDDSRYTSVDGSSLRMAMAMRASPTMSYNEEPTGYYVVEIMMYTSEWRTTSKQSGVSVRLYSGDHYVSEKLLHYSIYVLVQDCDSQCTTTCTTHAILGFSWIFYSRGDRASGPAPAVPIDNSLINRTASANLYELMYKIQQRSAKMIEAASNKARVGMISDQHYLGGSVHYGLHTDLETMARLSTFALDLEISKAWPGFLESTFALDLEISKAWPIFLKWVMEQLHMPGFGKDAANR
jgi:hypothetical protein